MGRFTRVLQAKSFGSGNWLPLLTATYDIKITEVKANDGQNGMSFIVEFEVTGIPIKPIENKDANGISVPQIGETRSYVCPLYGDQKKRAAGESNMRAFLEVVAGDEGLPEDEDEFDALCESICGAEQVCAGMTMELRTFPVKTGSGVMITKHVWELK